MEAYKLKLQKRVRLMGAGTLLGTAVVVFSRFATENTLDTTAPDFWKGYAHGFPLGLLFAFIILMVVQIIRINKATRDDALMQKMYREETDERTRMIQEKAGGVGYSFALAALVVAGIAAAYFSIVVSITLFCVVMFMSLVKIYLKVYYSRKF